MNTLSTATMTDPFGKTSECIQFSIDDAANPFVLNDVMTIGQRYTFSLWLMSAENASLSAGGDTFISTSAWSRYSVTFIANGTDLLLNFDTAGIYYIFHPQLEIGTLATDWTPAPEDQSDEMEARFTIESDKIQSQFTAVNESINDLGEVIKEKYIKTITENENGISITDSSGIYEIRVDNVEGVTILKNGIVRSQLVDDDFYTGNIVVKVEERAQFGNFAFIPRSDGSLSFLKVGD